MAITTRTNIFLSLTAPGKYLKSLAIKYILLFYLLHLNVQYVQVAPAELEDLLVSHPSIVDAAVVPEPEPILGTVPKAFVVKIPSSQVTEEDLIRFIAGKDLNSPYVTIGKKSVCFQIRFPNISS